MVRKLKVLISYLFLFLFLGYYGCITLFWHSHHFGNDVVVHSHPYNNPNHSHTAAQYDFIKIISAFSGLAAATGLLLGQKTFWKKQLAGLRPTAIVLQSYFSTYYRRGPPVPVAA